MASISGKSNCYPKWNAPVKSGRFMLRSHQDMGINEADWAHFIEIVTSVAGELGVGPTEGGEVMEFLGSLKADIVTA